MSTNGYQRYHGRMPRWKKTLIVVLVLVLAGAGGFLFLQNYQVFRDDGVHLRLPGGTETPSASSSESEQTDPLGEDELVIDEPEPSSQALYGRTISAETAQSGDFSALQDGEQPVISVKEANGTALLGSGADASVSAALSAAISGKNAVARISCFADTETAESDSTMALMSVSGRAWRDPDGNCYLNPYAAETTEYLSELVKACVSAGFTEIMLEDISFPSVGRLDRIVYDDGQDTDESRIAAVNAFVAAMKAAAGDDVAVTVVLPETLLSENTDGAAGLDLAALAKSADRICIPVAGQEEADSARAAIAALTDGADSTQCFVAEVGASVSGGSYVIVS